MKKKSKANSAAQNWANSLAERNSMGHSGNSRFGENVSQNGVRSMTYSQAALQATQAWYNEVSLYNYNRPGYSVKTGHFTQVVWKNSNCLGIGVARSNSGIYVVANYYPPGNFGNQFPQNVMRP